MEHLAYHVWVLNHYRTAEMHGADLLQRMLRRIDDPTLMINLSHHLADEAHHAWLWTELICELGGTPAVMHNCYQHELRRRVGLPSSTLELLALSHVVEERVQVRYGEHARREGEDPRIVAVLKTIMSDEEWHLAWVAEWLMEQQEREGHEKVAQLLARYRTAEADAYAALRDEERFEWEQAQPGKS